MCNVTVGTNISLMWYTESFSKDQPTVRFCGFCFLHCIFWPGNTYVFSEATMTSVF